MGETLVMKRLRLRESVLLERGLPVATDGAVDEVLATSPYLDSLNELLFEPDDDKEAISFS